MCLLLAAKAPELMSTEAHHGRMENETPEACIRSAGLFLPGKEQRKKIIKSWQPFQGGSDSKQTSPSHASVWGAVLTDRQDQLQLCVHHLAASSASGFPAAGNGLARSS